MTPQSAPQPLDAAESSAVREFVDGATAVMLRRLEDGLRRGWGLSFRTNYPDGAVLDRLDRTLGHLEDALARYREGSVGDEEVAKRAADVANQAFMLADPGRLTNNLPETPEAREKRQGVTVRP